ncbi:MAG: hypothetical protein LBL83_13220, partial [Clostridiales bacterium]|nr:hypothetical protein [Clostridiales bacterium]
MSGAARLARICRLCARTSEGGALSKCLTFAMCALMSVTLAVSLLMRLANAEFFASAALRTNGGAVSLYVDNRANAEIPIALDGQPESGSGSGAEPGSLELLPKPLLGPEAEMMELLGPGDSVERYISGAFAICGEKRLAVLRFQSGMDAAGCVLSSKAARAMGIGAGDELVFDELGLSFEVLAVEDSTFSGREALPGGYATFGAEWAEALAGGPEAGIPMRVAFRSSEENAAEARRLLEGRGLRVDAITAAQVAGDYRIAYEGAQGVLTALCFLSFALFMLGASSVSALAAEKSRVPFAIFRLCGFARRDAALAALAVSLAYALPAAALAMPAAALIFGGIGARLSGGVAVGVGLPEILATGASMLPLSACALFFSRLRALMQVFELDVADTLQGRSGFAPKSGIAYFAGAVFAYLALAAPIFARSGAAGGDALPLGAALAVAAALLFFAGRGALALLRRLMPRFRLGSARRLALRMALGGERGNGLICGSFAAAAAMLVFLCNATLGLPALIGEMWSQNEGYSACAQVGAEAAGRFEALMDERGLEYFEMYTKLMTYWRTDRYYYLGILRDERGVSPALKVERGTFKADRIVTSQAFGFRGGNSYDFLGDGRSLTFSGITPIQAFTPASHTILASYGDLGGMVDDSFAHFYMFPASSGEIAALRGLLAQWPVELTTSNMVADIIMSAFGDYLSVVYAVAIQAAAALVLFLLALLATTLHGRSPSMSIMRAAGAGYGAIRRLIVEEYAMLGAISLLVALLLNTVLINAALAMAGNYYAMPPWLAALAALAFEA